MNNITQEVFLILTKYERARSDDMFLYCKIAQARECAYEPLTQVLLHLSDYNMPPFETVRRSRQKVQELRPDLKPGEEHIAKREQLKEKFEEYARYK